MKTSMKKLFVLPVLLAAVGLMPASRVTAQTITTLHVFGINGNNDGANPQAGLVSAGGVVYGTTYYGGNSGYYGSVFALSLIHISSVIAASQQNKLVAPLVFQGSCNTEVAVSYTHLDVYKRQASKRWGWPVLKPTRTA